MPLTPKSNPLRTNIEDEIKLNSNDLIFNSYFESGNLDLALAKNAYEYDLFMRVDVNTRGHLNW